MNEQVNSNKLGRLINAAHDGDNKAFDALYRLYDNRIRATVRPYCFRNPWCEDELQSEARISFWKACLVLSPDIKDFDSYAASYIHTTLTRYLIDRSKLLWAQVQQIPDGYDAPADGYDDEQLDRQELCDRLMSYLSPLQQEILYRYFWRGERHRDIASDLKMTRCGVTCSVFRALRKMAKMASRSPVQRVIPQNDYLPSEKASEFVRHAQAAETAE